MFYREKKIDCGSYREADIIPRTDSAEKAVKGRRGKSKKVSEPKQKDLNEKNSKRYLVQLGNGNFGAGDLHVTFTYKEAGLNVTKDQLRAIAQAAYENMMKGAAEAQQPQEIAQAASTARYYEIGRRKFAEASTVVINVPGGSAAVSVPGVAVATDNVPEGALEPNPDGSVNAYDEAGLKVGTVDADTAEVVAAGVDVVIVEGGQAAQGAAKAAPEAAGGTDTATAAEGAQNAPQTAQDGQQEHDNT